MNDAVEFALLLKSHGQERAKELISQRYSQYGDQKPWLVLYDKREPSTTATSAKGQSQNAPRKSKKKSKTNAHLKEFLESGNKQYSKYLPLNELWLGYMKTIGTSDANKILSCDWHGAQISVESAKSPGYVGKSGILLWEARTMFIIITKQNKLVKIPKSGCVFKLHGLDKQVRLIGDRLLCRSAERTTRKFKPHNVDDIQGYL